MEEPPSDGALHESAVVSVPGVIVTVSTGDGVETSADISIICTPSSANQPELDTRA